MDEKDRLGTKLREKERAEEDRYFAERDRFRCPKCGERLSQRLLHGVTIDECPGCQGIWLDIGELKTVSQRGEEGWIEKFLEGLKHLLERPRG